MQNDVKQIMQFIGNKCHLNDLWDMTGLQLTQNRSLITAYVH